MTLAVFAATFYTFRVSYCICTFITLPVQGSWKDPVTTEADSLTSLMVSSYKKHPPEQGQATILSLWSKSWRGYMTFPRSEDNPWREASCISRTPSFPSPPAGLSPSCSRQQGENWVLQALFLKMTHFLSVFIMWRRRWLRNCSSINKSWVVHKGWATKGQWVFSVLYKQLALYLPTTSWLEPLQHLPDYLR